MIICRPCSIEEALLATAQTEWTLLCLPFAFLHRWCHLRVVFRISHILDFDINSILLSRIRCPSRLKFIFFISIHSSLLSCHCCFLVIWAIVFAWYGLHLITLIFAFTRYIANQYGIWRLHIMLTLDWGLKTLLCRCYWRQSRRILVLIHILFRWLDFIHYNFGFSIAIWFRFYSKNRQEEFLLTFNFTKNQSQPII